MLLVCECFCWCVCENDRLEALEEHRVEVKNAGVLLFLIVLREEKDTGLSLN